MLRVGCDHPMDATSRARPEQLRGQRSMHDLSPTATAGHEFRAGSLPDLGPRPSVSISALSRLRTTVTFVNMLSLLASHLRPACAVLFFHGASVRTKTAWRRHERVVQFVSSDRPRCTARVRV